MQADKFPSINVLTVIRGFDNPKLRFHITPYRFELQNGEQHHIEHIRQMHRERVGQSWHYHFVVCTKEQRYFHILFDTGPLTWRLVQEVDEQLLFN